jgi:hypothetical protein
MKSEVLLLEHIISLWDINEQGFRIGMQLLTIEMEDVYFLTGLSKRGSYSFHWAEDITRAGRRVFGTSLCSESKIGGGSDSYQGYP